MAAFSDCGSRIVHNHSDHFNLCMKYIQSLNAAFLILSNSLLKENQAATHYYTIISSKIYFN